MPILTALAESLASTPPFKWGAEYDRLRRTDDFSPTQCGEGNLPIVLNDAAARLALAAGYFGGRHMGLDHDQAVARAHKAQVAVRKALGYFSPEAGTFPF